MSIEYVKERCFDGGTKIRDYAVEGNKILLAETRKNFRSEYIWEEKITEKIKTKLSSSGVDVCFYTTLLIYENKNDLHPRWTLEKLIFSYKESFYEFYMEIDGMYYTTYLKENNVEPENKDKWEFLEEMMMDVSKFRLQILTGLLKKQTI